MGERVAIQFVDDEGHRSAVLNSQWGGRELIDWAVEFVEEIKEDFTEQTPLGRLEAGHVMADFVRHLSEPYERLDCNYSLGLKLGRGSNHGSWEIHVSRTGPTVPVMVIPPEFPSDEDEDE